MSLLAVTSSHLATPVEDPPSALPARRWQGASLSALCTRPHATAAPPLGAPNPVPRVGCRVPIGVPQACVAGAAWQWRGNASIEARVRAPRLKRQPLGGARRLCAGSVRRWKCTEGGACRDSHSHAAAAAATAAAAAALGLRRPLLVRRSLALPCPALAPVAAVAPGSSLPSLPEVPSEVSPCSKVHRGHRHAVAVLTL